MKKKSSKGTLGQPKLSLSKNYIVPPSRKRLFLWGGLGTLVLLALIAVNVSFFKGTFLANGPLASAHAGMSGDCNACHTAFTATAEDKCVACHETGGNALGAFSFSAHYLYHTQDFQRDIPSGKEHSCSTCHQEHMGRTAQISAVTDARCLTCHDGHRFDKAHPVFAKASEPEPVSLKFPHVAHIRELMQERDLQSVEETCAQCHELSSDGAHFKPLSFDAYCDDCHLNSSETTPRLPIATNETIGVRTLETIRANQTAGSRWTMFANPAEYRVVANRFVSKSPLHHKDPWILENLRQLRKQIYPDAGLADLIQADVDVPADQLKTLYEEAIATLGMYADELRSRPEQEVQAELVRIHQSLDILKKKLEDPYVVLDETEFLLALQQKRQGLTAEELEETETLANDLTQPCQTCHVVQDFTIKRVDISQRAFTKATFNHAAHLIQSSCLDCHNKFPAGSFLFEEAPDVEMPASVQNLPDIETCRTCHSQNAAANSCITCHQFHPENKRFSPQVAQFE